ncbi:MAG: hypothetical protein WCK42_07640, partial [Myxococcaceae bacterium]
YAQNQIKRRYEKLKVRNFANDLQLMGGGVGLTGVGAIAGTGLTIANWSIKAGVSGRSLGTFIKKLWNQTLGVERTHHAEVLHKFALQHLEETKDRDLVATEKAFKLLQGLGILSENPNTEEIQAFRDTGVKRIKVALRT